MCNVSKCRNVVEFRFNVYGLESARGSVTWATGDSRRRWVRVDAPAVPHCLGSLRLLTPAGVLVA